MIHQSERRNSPENYWLMKTKLLSKYPRGRPQISQELADHHRDRI